jgi:hypothetical protein
MTFDGTDRKPMILDNTKCIVTSFKFNPHARPWISRNHFK